MKKKAVVRPNTQGQSNGSIVVEVETGDVVNVKAHLLAVKSSAELYGASVAIADELNLAREVRRKIADQPVLIESRGRVGADAVLFQPAPPITHFDYRDVRNFARDVLKNAARLAPNIERLAITLHGPGIGLDEREAFEAEIGGLVESVNRGTHPATLRQIIFVERGAQRAERLRGLLQQVLPNGIARRVPWARSGRREPAGVRAAEPSKAEAASFERLKEAGVKSRQKPLVFVAMPFAKAHSDVFNYGIRNAVKRSLGRDVLLERADLQAFLGDVMQHVRDRIAGAALVIADMSGANANVYLEIGFAWGSGRPTVLIVNTKRKDVKFDVRGQRYLEYETIEELEAKLVKELKGLKAQLFPP